MCSKKLSLFDALIKELSDETRFQDLCVLSDDMVSYTSSRTGRKAYCSYARYMAITSLVPALHKRYIGPTVTVGAKSLEELHSAAVSEFLEDNARCEEFNKHFSVFNLDVFSQLVAGEVQVLLSKVLDSSDVSLNLSTIAAGMRVGPGSSSGVKGDSGTYGRLAGGAMSFSSVEVQKVYKACALMNPLAYKTEAVRSDLFGFRDSFSTVACFNSVPKTNLKNRGICTQPSGNMALQLATHSVLSTVLIRSFGCDLSNQQFHNRKLAEIGSRGQVSFNNLSWNFCTFDLSRASNFPLKLIEALFPNNWCQWVNLIRSPSMNVDGVVYEKHMCSTMGNGFTFALMTTLLSAIVKTLYLLADLPEYDTSPIYGKVKTWAVYGDDIIVDRKVANALFKVLAAFGFLINSKKTFTQGLFRESCGGDYYNGSPVRPVFVETLQTQADVFSLLNRLVQWGVTHSVDIPRSLKILRGAVIDDLRIPNWEDVSHGFHVPYSHNKTVPVKLVPLRLRRLVGINKGITYYEVLHPVVKHRSLFKEKTTTVKYSSVSTRELLSYEVVTQTEMYGQNVPGMLFCTLEGSVRKGRYGVRSNGLTPYDKVWKFTPAWGDPTLFGGTATRISTGTTGAVYKLWEEYVRRVCFSKREQRLTTGLLCCPIEY